jgi:NAD(P)H-hydrate repair Nnr-like enzyme with NAD(P)H-hydrate epimerase domain
MNNNKNAQGWADTDVNSFREEEFDFQKHLNKFNKAEIFAEIRVSVSLSLVSLYINIQKDSDKTSKEDLLVTHNRLPQRNLLPTENVLDAPVKLPSSSPPSSIRAPAVSTALKTATSGTPCPLLSVTELIRIQRKCTTVSPRFEDLAIENSARGAAVLAMRLLRHSHLSSSIVILAGNTRIGAIGLATARLLIDRGYPATICIVCHDRQALCPDVAREEELLHNFGIPVVYDPSRIQGAYDLVMDAILGSENKLMDNLAEFHAWTKAISWANQQPKPIMSIDFPSGVDADTGIKKKKILIRLNLFSLPFRSPTTCSILYSSSMDCLSWCSQVGVQINKDHRRHLFSGHWHTTKNMGAGWHRHVQYLLGGRNIG